ncbi:MAG: cyclic-phosphate processing receiver domain-containing protein [Planctomycetota bacterium]
MAVHNAILILEDSPARVQRFERVLHQQLPQVQPFISQTAGHMRQLIEMQMKSTFVISLDHDLHVPGVDDPGDGLKVAQFIASKQSSCPVIIHTSNAVKSREMQGTLEAENWSVRLAGAIGEYWIEKDWIMEVAKAYEQQTT